MNLDSVTAQHIVEQLAPNLDTDIWIVGRSSHVLASTQAKQAQGQSVTTEAELPGQRGRTLSLPLRYADQEVGMLVIAGAVQQNQEAAYVAKTLAELIIYQAAVFEQLVDRQSALNRFVYHLLHGQAQDNPKVVLQEASLLEIDLACPRAVIVFDLSRLFVQRQAEQLKPNNAPSYLSQWQQLRRRLLQQVDAHFPAQAAHLCAFPDEQWLVVLAVIDPNQAEKWRPQLKRVVQNTLEECEQIAHIALRAGIGDYYPHWGSLTRSYEDACFALKVGCALYDDEQIFTIADLGLAAFVCTTDPTVSAKLATALLTPLLAEPELLSTLEVFLEMNLSPSQAAQKLSIHRHTLAYRLQKIADLTGVDPHNFQDATRFLAALLWYKAVPKK